MIALRLALVAALCCTSMSSQAGTYAATVTKSGNVYNIKTAPSNVAANDPRAATLSQTPQGVAVGAPVGIQLTNAVAVGLSAASVITAAATAPVWATAAAAVGLVAMLAIPAFQDAYSRAKLRVNPTTGALEHSLASSDVCTVAPCYEYQAQAYFGSGPWVAGTKEQALTAWLGTAYTINYDASMTVWYASGPGNFQGGWGSRTVAPAAAEYAPITPAAAAEKLWPDARAPTIAEVQALYDLNFPPEPSKPVITGPAEVPLANTVQLMSPGEKKYVAEIMKLEYEAGQVKATKQTTTTVTKDASTGTVTTTNPDGSTSTSTVVRPATSTTVVTEGAQTPSSETDPCAAAADRIGCADMGSAQETPLPTSSKAVSFAPVVFASNASCPAPLSVNYTLPMLGSRSHSLSFSKLCDGAAIVRLFLLLGSWITACFIFVKGLGT